MNRENELLGRYADQGDQQAFAALVADKVALVYSAALRQVGGNAHLAEEVTQGVFLALAAQARQLKRHPTVTGWLYTTTRRVAAKALRTDARWRRREWEANAMHAQQPPATPWDELRPTIDEAMNDLSTADRTALLLRFFEARSHGEVGATLGLSENAARMRVERALEKLRGQLARRGITSTAAALGGALAANAVGAAPESLAAGVAAHALAGASALGAIGAAGPASLALTFMITTKLIGAAAAALALLAAGGYLGVRYGSAVTFDRGGRDSRESANTRAVNPQLGATALSGAALFARSTRPKVDGSASTTDAPITQAAHAAINRDGPYTAETLATLAGKWQILAQLQKDRVISARLALVDDTGKLSDAAVKIFDVSPAEHDALATAIDSARQNLAALERQNAVVSTPAADKVSIHVAPFPEAGGAVYDALMKTFADTLGPQRNAAFLELAGSQVDQVFAKFGAESRTLTVTSQPNSPLTRYVVTEEQISTGSNGTSTSEYRTLQEVKGRFGTIVNLLPPNF